MKWSDIVIGIGLSILGMLFWYPVTTTSESFIEQIKFDIVHNYIAIVFILAAVVFVTRGGECID